MLSPESFLQRPAVGCLVVVAGPAVAAPHLTRVSGLGSKGGSPVVHHSDGAAWARPEDVTIIPDRLAMLMDVVRDETGEQRRLFEDGAEGGAYLAAAAVFDEALDDAANTNLIRSALSDLANERGAGLAPGI